jgi:hypothetical protein
VRRTARVGFCYCVDEQSKLKRGGKHEELFVYGGICRANCLGGLPDDRAEERESEARVALLKSAME